jgi:hypothetical protein
VRPSGGSAASREGGPFPEGARRRDDDLHAALAVADAVLLEGYLLYPYRRSSAKNHVRWQFGVLLPPAWARSHGLDDESVAGSAESWWQQTECLLEPGGAAGLRVRLRFLQVQHRSVDEATREAERPADHANRVDHADDVDHRVEMSATYRPVDELHVGERLEVAFDEAVPQDVDLEVPIDALVGHLIGQECPIEFDVRGGDDVQTVLDDAGTIAGRLVRHRLPVAVRVHLRAERCDTPFPLLRLRIRVENAGAGTDPKAPRSEALRSSLVATHVVLVAPPSGRFLSLLDPPEWAAEAARACRNVHTFPVLAGERDGDDVVLSAPIILDDHPRIAPESPGDLHDAGEIDEILTLRTLTLTDDEKREARATDARAAAIVDRVDDLPPEIMERLHGAVRSLRPAPGSGQASPTVVVAGFVLGTGSRVRLWPRRRGTDAHDMFLEGRTATVAEVLLDVDGSRFLAVTVDDDPGAELHQWYGRLRHFRPEEVQPLPDPTAAASPTAVGGERP